MTHGLKPRRICTVKIGTFAKTKGRLLMKKRIAFLLAALVVLTGFAFGDSLAKNGMLVAPGSLNANIGLGLHYGSGFGIGGGIEYPIGKFLIDNKIPFTYGIAGRAGLDLINSVSLSAGVFGTLHFCWGALNLPQGLYWLGNFDSYIGIGLRFIPGVNFDTIGGLSYYVTRNVAINLESGLKASYIGILLKL
jgi:hypothetical protein